MAPRSHSAAGKKHRSFQTQVSAIIEVEIDRSKGIRISRSGDVGL
jgi:hypothetical protein